MWLAYIPLAVLVLVLACVAVCLWGMLREDAAPLEERADWFEEDQHG